MRKYLLLSVCMVTIGLCGTAIGQQSFYSIHISSHKQRQEAAAEAGKLGTKGLDAFYRFARIKDKGDWYRVYVGQYSSRQQATADIQRLKRMQISKYFAVTRLKAATSDKAKAAAAASAAKPAVAPKVKQKKPTAENYYLFVGFYRDLDQAQKEVRRLNRALTADGYQALLTREPLADGTMYRVYIGTFSARQQAADAGAALKRQKTLTSFYIPVQTPQDMRSGLVAAPPGKSTSKKAAAAAPAAAAVESRAKTKKRSSAGTAAKKPAATKAASKGSASAFKRFLVMLKAGGYSPQNVSDFEITESDPLTGTTVYRISDDITPQVGIEGAVRFNPWIGLYGNFDGIFLDGISWFNLSAGPLLTVEAGDGVMPYLKGGAVFGDISWSDAPGSFDAAVGWEAGLGLHVLKSNVKIGLDFNYRSIAFDYQAPNDPLVGASEDQLDMGGYSLMGTVSFWF